MILGLVKLVVAASDAGLIKSSASGEHSEGKCTGGIELPITHIPDCRKDVFLHRRSCLAFTYVPANDSFVRSIVSGIQHHNVPSIPNEQVTCLPQPLSQ